MAPVPRLLLSFSCEEVVQREEEEEEEDVVVVAEPRTSGSLAVVIEMNIQNEQKTTRQKVTNCRRRTAIVNDCGCFHIFLRTAVVIENNDRRSSRARRS